jgi:hypothetical protein
MPIKKEQKEEERRKEAAEINQRGYKCPNNMVVVAEVLRASIHISCECGFSHMTTERNAFIGFCDDHREHVESTIKI